MRYLIPLSALLVSCAHGSPNLHGQLWAGASSVQGIQRAQDSKIMECKEPAFDEYVCLKFEDLKSFKESCREYYK